MKKITLLLLFFFSLTAFSQTVTYSISPTVFNETDAITITFNGNSINESTWGVTGNALYLWAWSFDLNDTSPLDCPTNGAWDNSNEANKLTYNTVSDTYTITFTPTTFYARTDIGRIAFLIKTKTGNAQGQDIFSEVGAFQVTMINPAPSANGFIFVNNGAGTQVLAQNTNGPANYELFVNGISTHTQNNTTFYNGYQFTGLTENKFCELVITQGATSITKSFTILVNTSSTASLPANMEDGINYNTTDPTKATLVIDAPFKDFVYVAGSFNNWQPSAAYTMKKDASSSKFWLELTGLTPGKIETYQYWVVDQTPITNSPALVKTADPYSTLVLSPFDDPDIPSTTYPNLPAYPVGQEREVTVLQTGQTNYPWQVTNFSKPKKEDLIIYEVLIRDFDADRNFQDVIDKIDYFKNLNINAIELMPIMEFEGNESWGYNTSFHMALDKFYGTENKFRELVDVCHQNGIAVILDVALNHAFGRNPMVRMWMNDPDKDGWGSPSSENPYFNTTAKHSYSVGEDFNHQSTYTQTYVKQVIKHWVEDFKIDGFRWDLTKGFTQNCTSANETCTNSYQQDRVEILQAYADYSWSLDETHYVIFEHLGADDEEQEWANYRIGDAIPKGVMMWSEMWNNYKELSNGNASSFDRMGNVAHGFTEKRTLGYPESHDKDRIMYEMITYGKTGTGYDIKDLNTALSRMSALGAVTIPIPGPKMLWHFADLGMNNSIWTCTNGIVNSDYDGKNDGDCKLSTKPQPQWANNWLENTNRNKIYNDWSRLNYLKINEDVFEGDYVINSGSQTPRISIYTGLETAPGADLKNVIIIANFSVTSQNVNPSFPYTGTWYDLMDNTSVSITNTTALIPLAAGQFRMYGNKPSTLNTESVTANFEVVLYPNPTKASFSINKNVEKLTIYNLTGKVVKSFKGNFSKDYEFNISNLPPSVYIVKIANTLEAETTLKMIKYD